MCKRDIKSGIKTLFTEGLDQFANHCKQTTGHSGLDENGQITDRYARIICTDYYIKGIYSKILTGLLHGDTFDENPKELDILYKSGLIDEKNKLTHNGLYKAISTSNFKNQINYLNLPLDESEPIMHKQGTHREVYAKNIYSEKYDFVIYDEGKIFESIKNCFIYSSRRYFLDYGFNPSLLKKIYHQPFEFQQAVCRGILMGERPVLAKIMKENKGLLEKENFQKNVEIVKRSVSEAIKNMNVDILLSDAKRVPWSVRVRQHEYAICPIEGAFRFLGEDAIRKFTARLFEHPTPDNRGWSDVTAFHQGEYIPIEVKGADKLTYPQIERYFWLWDNVPEHAKNQRVSKILLC